VSRWPKREAPPRVEPPAWLRVFDPAAWATPDEVERDLGEGLGDAHRAWHAKRRWVEARNQWFRETPGGQASQLRELLAGLRPPEGSSAG
jgi:hypothetical protein